MRLTNVHAHKVASYIAGILLGIPLFLGAKVPAYAACNFSDNVTQNTSTFTFSGYVCSVDTNTTEMLDYAPTEGSTANAGVLKLTGGSTVTLNTGAILSIGGLDTSTTGVAINGLSNANAKILLGDPRWAVDADADGWPRGLTVGSDIITATTAGARRLGLMKKPIAPDCNDNAFSETNTCCVIATRYRDLDGDTYGNPSVSISACTTAGYVDNNTDCNDSDGTISRTISPAKYLDADGDGYGVGALTSCAPQTGNYTSANNTDCNDTGTNSANVYAAATCYTDTDNDNYGDYNSAALTCTNNATCTSATWASGGNGTTASSGNFAANNTDCGNSNANAHPSSTYCGSTGFTNQANAANNFDYNCNTIEAVCAPDLTQVTTATWVDGSEGIGSCNNNNADCRSSAKNTWNNAAIACGANGRTCTQTGTVGGQCASCGGTSGGTVKCIAVSAISTQTCR